MASSTWNIEKQWYDAWIGEGILQNEHKLEVHLRELPQIKKSSGYAGS